MKTEEELKEWFWDLYNSCYIVKHDDFPYNDFLLYDENFIRQAKLKTILNEEIIYPEKPNGIWLFKQDWKSNFLYIEYNNIWLVLKTNLGYNYQEIKDLVKGWLEEYDKLRVLTPKHKPQIKINQLEEHNKLKVLTPGASNFISLKSLNDHNKLKVLTPEIYDVWESSKLEEHNKLKVFNK